MIGKTAVPSTAVGVQTVQNLCRSVAQVSLEPPAAPLDTRPGADATRSTGSSDAGRAGVLGANAACRQLIGL